MKKRTVLLSLMLVLGLAAIGSGTFLLVYVPTITEAKVVSVIDGDTIIIDSGESVRLIGIDAPERDEEFYDEAKEYLRDWLLNTVVKLEKDKENRDQYGRLLRYVWRESTLVNHTLVRSGYAKSYPYPPNIKYIQILDAAEIHAKQQEIGIWDNYRESGATYTPPSLDDIMKERARSSGGSGSITIPKSIRDWLGIR